MTINTGYLKAKRSSESDECYTPAQAVMPIIPYLKAKGFKKIWCPFDTEKSYYVKLLLAHGFEVTNSHISTGGDFFNISNYDNIEYDCIVSNPPYSRKDEVLKKVYELNKPFALLLPIPTLQSADRTPLFKENGLELLVFDKRICFYTNGDFTKVQKGIAFATGYFCRDVLPEKLMFEIYNS